MQAGLTSLLLGKDSSRFPLVLQWSVHRISLSRWILDIAPHSIPHTGTWYVNACCLNKPLLSLLWFGLMLLMLAEFSWLNLPGGVTWSESCPVECQGKDAEVNKSRGQESHRADHPYPSRQHPGQSPQGRCLLLNRARAGIPHPSDRESTPHKTSTDSSVLRVPTVGSLMVHVYLTSPSQALWCWSPDYITWLAVLCG